MSKKNNVIHLKKYKWKKKKEQNKRWFVLIPVCLSIVTVLFALLYFINPPNAKFDVTKYTENQAFFYK